MKEGTVTHHHHLLEQSSNVLGHVAAIVIGFILMVVGLALGVTMVLLPVGFVVGIAGVLLFVGGLFNRWSSTP